MATELKYPFFEKLQDISFILRGIWFLILFDLLALYAFFIASQGTDVLLTISEDLGGSEIFTQAWTGTFLIIALFFWCVVSEFCTRFLIYITDNSGKSLAPHRVHARKSFQLFAAKVSLFFPLALMFFAFIKALWINYSDLNQTKNLTDLNQIIGGTLIIISLIVLETVLVYKLYPGGWIRLVSEKYKSLYWLCLTVIEKQWLIKLYGILDDVRVDIPVTNKNFTGADLPRDVELPNGMRLPESTYFQPYSSNPKKEGGINIWMFKVHIRFFHSLFRQLIVFGILSVCLIFIFGSLLPVEAYLNIGAAALVCLAFACWQIIYVLLHVLDKTQSVFPVRLFVIGLLLFSSITNSDHPVRELSGINTKRQTLDEHFNNWYENLRNDTLASTYYRIGLKDSIPVIFIAAEGGALRTGAFTAMTLAKLQDTFPEFYKYVYCYSGVSGGALGSNFFNAELLRHVNKEDTTTYTYATQRFFKNDFLAPVTGKLVFGEVINYFIPWHIESMDRAIALEQIWEYAWKQIYPAEKHNILEESFNGTIKSNLPAVFINTTEVETGLQCVWSSVELSSIPLYQQRDLYRRVNKELAYSTAINLSTRFPLISPGASFSYKIKEGRDTVNARRHFVDGGYYENKGAETLIQIMQALKLKRLPIKPYVLQFNFGETDSSFISVNSFNEIKEVVSGIYNTREGRGAISQYQLQQFVRDSLKGEFINLNLTLNTKSIPMNWILSNTAVNRLSALIGQSVNMTSDNGSNDKQELSKLFLYNKDYTRKRD